ncbi:MAG TPA: sigma-54 dependent transcriptional regulator [Polyangiaceae bacterium]|nr:sigma-54 dependent transcriptional regulator [Polyangiaceae bacterium]
MNSRSSAADDPARDPSRSRGPVMVVDDDESIRRLVRRCLESQGFEIVEYSTGAAAIDAMNEQIAAVCLDLGLEDVPGMDVLRHLRVRHPSVPVIVVTGQCSVEMAVEAVRAGASDFVMKPIEVARITSAVSTAVYRNVVSSPRSPGAVGASEIVGDSPPMRALIRQMVRVADSDVAVCVRGESGTGKELVARAVHECSRRKGKPFVAINCAAIPQALQESELFGHERGAFTGAVGTHRGRLEQAQDGTLFLDEIGEMSPATQASLLRALQEKTIRRVGGVAELRINVRVVSATHRNLEDEVRAGRFREDLYFRLIVYPLSVPPLRERTSDIPALVACALDKHAADVGRKIVRMSPDALRAMDRYPWPGNVRELENAVHRAMLASDDDEIRLEHLPPHISACALAALTPPPAAPVPPSEHLIPEPPSSTSLHAGSEVRPLRDLERAAIIQALQSASGSVTKAARMLGMARATMYRKLAEFEIRTKPEQ